jgi:lipopolysaccharide/colanic/teichoic acid biosynthesis glycosyltransferase
VIKRLFDVTLAGAGLLVSSPLWGAIAIAILAEDGRPIFFRQERVGKDGRVFFAYKFRSMIRDAEGKTGPVQATERDPRITRVGHALRATAMDELPQLWNIFIGDMSFVGPRPLRPGEIDVADDGKLVALEAIPGYRERHAVRPGLTGIAQVYAARDLPRIDKFRLDRLYLKRAGLCLDLRLIAQSFWITGLGQWESRNRRRMLGKAKKSSL